MLWAMMCVLADGSRVPEAKAALTWSRSWPPPVFNALGRVKNRGKHPETFFLEMLRDAPKILDAELYTESKDTVDQDDIHGSGSYQVEGDHG